MAFFLVALLTSSASAILQRAELLSADNAIGAIASLADGRFLTYYGGPVLSNVQVQPIWYGNTSYQTEINSFYAAVTKSPWFDILLQYNIQSGSASAGISFSGTMYTALDDTTDIQPMLLNMVRSGAITPTENTYFPIHFQPGTSISIRNYLSCSYFCAYHSYVDISSLNMTVKTLYYGVIPDQSGECASGCGRNALTVNNLFAVSSHELAEAITDPNAASPAWYDSNVDSNGQQWGEAADICNEKVQLLAETT
ncbi:hypothetical protein HDU82_004900 [Entophlyctis luteolus]|nr:hypothetical protein HDU82_004900 [Entophlyctis luteolus]